MGVKKPGRWRLGEEEVGGGRGGREEWEGVVVEEGREV